MIKKTRINEADAFYEIALIVAVTIFFCSAELFANDDLEYARLQSKSVYGFSFILFLRVVFFSRWFRYYHNAVGYLMGQKYESFPLVSILNVVLDIYVVLLLFFWIDVEKLHFVSVPVIPIVYVVLAGIQLGRVALLQRKFEE